MRFSICIPNYNYAHYLPRTLESVRSQEAELEVLISDNASTDGSVEAARSLGDARIRVQVNEANVGFAGNLDRAARMATGDLMLMLSSDDVMRPGALTAYQRLFSRIEADAVVTSAADVIDPSDNVTGRLSPDPALWTAADVVPAAGLPGTLYRVEARELLRRSVRSMKNPVNFLSTAFPRRLYQRVEGYGGGRLINPDKWFHWRLLGVASAAYYLDAPLFAYRWHPTNQTAQQAASGALKYLVDEYVNTFELDKALLESLGISRNELEAAFVEHDIARHGLATLARGDRVKARRTLLFGAAAYPGHAASNWKLWALAGLLATGPIGETVARWAYARRRGDLGA